MTHPALLNTKHTCEASATFSSHYSSRPAIVCAWRRRKKKKKSPGSVNYNGKPRKWLGPSRTLFQTITTLLQEHGDVISLDVISLVVQISTIFYQNWGLQIYSLNWSHRDPIFNNPVISSKSNFFILSFDNPVSRVFSLRSPLEQHEAPVRQCYESVRPLATSHSRD